MCLSRAHRANPRLAGSLPASVARVINLPLWLSLRLRLRGRGRAAGHLRQRRPELRLGVEQEVGANRDVVARLHAGENLRLAVAPDAHLHLARLEGAVARVHEHDLTDAGFDLSLI